MMPGTPRFKIQRPTEDMDILDVVHQKKDCTGVGMLLYLTKYSRPDICNVVREISKFMDSSTKETYQEMLYVVKFVIDTKNFGLKVEPKIDDNLE
jgi:hypothetical protein